MGKLKVYLDTSVIGGCFDKEFEEFSNLLFLKFQKKLYVPLISEVVLAEIEKAPLEVRQKLEGIKAVKVISVTEEMKALAKKYIKEKIVTPKYADDALHIAISTIVNADVLVSWNFKHIVNLKKIHEFNRINKKEGYDILEIRTPREVVEYE